MTYRSKVDWWLALVLGALFVMQIVLGYLAWTKGRRTQVLTHASAAALVVAVTCPTRYTIGSSELKIRSGVRRWKIPLSSIVQVFPTRDLRSNPALSMDRLQIDRDDGRRIQISPKDQQRFLQELSVRANLRQFENRLVREEPARFSQLLS